MRSAITVTMNSSAAEAPIAWPWTALVELTARRVAWSPKTRLTIGGLGRVVQTGRGSVRVDVVDVFRRQAGLVERDLDGTCRRVDARLRQVSGVGGRAVPGELGENFRAARRRVLPRLEHHDAGAFAKHHSRSDRG